MAKRVKTPSAKPNNLSLIAGTHKVVKTTPARCLTSAHTHDGMGVPLFK